MKLLVISLKYESVKKKEGTTQVINPFSEGPFAYIGMEMILLTVASIILLKYKYFINILFIILYQWLALFYSEILAI